MPDGSSQGSAGEVQVVAMTRAQRGIALAIVAVYLGVTLALAFTARPQNDEAIYANPGYNLVHTGKMGLTLYPMPDLLPLSAAQRTYVQPPLYFLVTTVLYRLAGFGLAQVRLLSIFLGLVCLVSWFSIIRKLTKSAALALLVTGLISVDYFFLVGASHGRMDMMCVSLGSAGLAVYIYWRDRNLRGAILGGNSLAALAVLTHPAGIVWAAAVLLAMLILESRSLSIRLFVLAAIPYLLAGACWGAYILQDLPAFREQMRAELAINEHSFDYSHLSNSRFLAYLEQEVLTRYLGPFGFLRGGSLAGHSKMLVLATYMAGALGILLFRKLRRNRAIVWLPVAFIAGFLLLAESSPSKFSYYLPHTTVILAACAGVFLYYLWPSPRWSVILPVVAVLAAIQLGGAAALVRRDDYHRDYQPEVSAIRRNSGAGAVVMSESEFWFELWRDYTILDDPALGFHLGIRPSIIVMNLVFRDLHERDRRAHPEIFEHVQSLLDASQLVYQDGECQIYRTDSSAAR